jgi:undecaprenyl-diphosphatase
MGDLTLIKALLLGAVQGATEFLPVSSSGHLTIVQWLFGLSLESGEMMAFDVCLHFGTLLAIVVIFWREIALMLSCLFRWDGSETLEVRVGMTHRQARTLALLLALGTVPAVIVGFLLKHVFEELFSNATAAGAMLLVTGIILWSTRWARERRVGAATMKWWHALAVGVAQAIAIVPGISRSGSTIAGGMWMGLTRDFAARFSFLLAVPAIAGASLLEVKELRYFSHEMVFAAVAGSAVAAVVGFACIKWLLGIVRRGHFSWFAIYCWCAGAATLAYAFLKR